MNHLGELLLETATEEIWVRDGIITIIEKNPKL